MSAIRPEWSNVVFVMMISGGCMKNVLFGTQESEVLNIEHTEQIDTVLIETLNSLYVFSMLDASSRLGIVATEGRLDAAKYATLLGSNPDENDKHEAFDKWLRVGERAVFFVDEPPRTLRVITSPIIRLTYTSRTALH